jgi:hypothetical protein
VPVIKQWVSLESKIRKLLELPMREMTRSQLWQQLMTIGEPYSAGRSTGHDNAAY